MTAGAMYEYPVTIHHIFISGGHNYFGRPKEGPGSYATVDAAEVEAVAGQGLAGDRYFGVAAHYDAQVTFVAWEVFQALQAEFRREDWSPILMRRNIVIAGVPLNQLIGQPFALDFGEHQVEFLGAKHCAPCAWMDAMLAPGAAEVPARPRRPAGENCSQRHHSARHSGAPYICTAAADGSPCAASQAAPAVNSLRATFAPARRCPTAPASPRAHAGTTVPAPATTPAAPCQAPLKLDSSGRTG